MRTSKTINTPHKSVYTRRQRNRIFEGKQGEKYLKSSVEKAHNVIQRALFKTINIPQTRDFFNFYYLLSSFNASDLISL